MMERSQVVDNRVDLDGVDMGRAGLECHGGIVAGTGTHDHDVVVTRREEVGDGEAIHLNLRQIGKLGDIGSVLAVLRCFRPRTTRSLPACIHNTVNIMMRIHSIFPNMPVKR